MAAIRLVLTLDPNMGRTVQCAGTWWAGHARGHRGAFDRRTRAGKTGTALERLQPEQSCGTSAARHTIFAVGTERLRSVTEGSHYPGKAIRVPTD
jgi:hypothetical protein